MIRTPLLSKLIYNHNTNYPLCQMKQAAGSIRHSDRGVQYAPCGYVKEINSYAFKSARMERETPTIMLMLKVS